MPRSGARIARDASAPGRLFVDSSAWIALLGRRDQHHVEAERGFRDAIRRRIPLLTSNLVLAEVHRFALFQSGARPARLALDLVEASARLTTHFADARHHAAAKRWLERFEGRPISYTDAVSFAVMEATGCRLVLGFDEDFTVAGFELWRPGR